jgi:hypothetical protein
MVTKFTLFLAMAAGFIGGLASRYAGSPVVYAQAPAVPQEIRAQRFVLIDETGVALGVFGIEKNGGPEIEVMDSKGRVYALVFRLWGQCTDLRRRGGCLAQRSRPYRRSSHEPGSS